ncbi:MAG: ATP-binding protein [Magnetospirillum sp.]
MIMIMRSMRHVTKISKKLMYLIIGFSSLITMVITGGQLLFEYRQQRGDVDTLLERVEVFLPTMAGAVWSFNESQIRLGLESLVQLPNIASATISAADGGQIWRAQSHQASLSTIRVYPLVHTIRGENRQIAHLEVVASLDHIQSRLLWQAAGLLLSNGVKTFLVAGFMYVLFRHLVTHRVEEMAAKVRGLTPQLAPHAMSFADPESEYPIRGDEIDEVRWAFDDMAQRLKMVIADLNARNTQLQAENQQRQQAEQSLRDAMDRLSHTMVELERFAYIAAHDLQEPIRSIVSFSQMLERRCAEALGDDGREFLSFIISESHRLSRLVKDLLEYSRCESQSLSLGVVDSNEALEAVRNSLSAAIAQKHATIVVENGPLPTITADPVQFHQLLGNLLGNSLKYVAAGQNPHIRVSAQRRDDGWQFSIADNGIGIEPQYSSYIFEVFRRLHTRDVYSGTGIGLSLCKRVVENHGGRIWVEPAPGGGSIFHFTLPDQSAIA